MIRIDMDVHVRRQVTIGLRLRGVDVLTAQEDNAGTLENPDLLNRASELERVLFSQDTDLLREAALRQRQGRPFCGVIFGQQQVLTIGQCIDDLELIAKVHEPADIADRVEFLPLA